MLFGCTSVGLPPKLKNTYDRLYIDLNGDLDLTNDPVVVPMKDPPSGAIRRYSSMRQAVVFEEVSVPLDLGPELGGRPVRLVPRLEIQEYEGKEYPGVEFLSAVVRQGEIKLGNQPYHAILAQRYVITGWYDCPLTTLLLLLVVEHRCFSNTLPFPRTVAPDNRVV